jgi:hypothetical protein
MRHVAQREFGPFGEDRAAEEHVARASERAREALGAFLAALPEGTGPHGVTWRQLSGDPALAAAREAWRAADREAVAARDDAVGLECGRDAAEEAAEASGSTPRGRPSRSRSRPRGRAEPALCGAA